MNAFYAIGFDSKVILHFFHCSGNTNECRMYFARPQNNQLKQSLGCNPLFKIRKWNSCFSWYFFLLSLTMLLSINVEYHALLRSIQKPHIHSVCGRHELQGVDRRLWKPQNGKRNKKHIGGKIILCQSESYSYIWSCMVFCWIFEAQPIDSSKCCTGFDKIRKQGRKYNQSRKKGRFVSKYVYAVCVCVLWPIIFVL